MLRTIFLTLLHIQSIQVMFALFENENGNWIMRTSSTLLPYDKVGLSIEIKYLKIEFVTCSE